MNTNSDVKPHTREAWVWRSTSAGDALTHMVHPYYFILHDDLQTYKQLRFWLDHLGEKNWITADDLAVIIQRYSERRHAR